MGAKKLYILDLTHAKGKGDSESDLMSCLESICNGMVISPMYGKAAQLLMEPPHIMVTSNYLLDYELLSMDRWKVYELKEDGSLGKENEIFETPGKRKAMMEKEMEMEKQRAEFRLKKF